MCHQRYYYRAKPGDSGHSSRAKRERWDALKKGWPVMLMPVVILVPLYAGVVTATETSAIAAAYSLLLGLVVYRELTWGKILHSFRWTVQICGMIFFIIIAATLLNKALVAIRVPFELSEGLSSAGLSAGIFMLVIIIAYLLMGMFLDPTAILLISVPILLESVTGLGISPVVYGIVVTVAVQVACMTPPYGIDLFAAVGILKEPFHIVARGTFLFYPAMMGGLIILAYVPDITFFLPRLFGLNV
ncbi:TRAP transporter large permease subunit [Chloroflexota bacterium]